MLTFEKTRPAISTAKEVFHAPKSNLKRRESTGPFQKRPNAMSRTSSKEIQRSQWSERFVTCPIPRTTLTCGLPLSATNWAATQTGLLHTTTGAIPRIRYLMPLRHAGACSSHFFTLSVGPVSFNTHMHSESHSWNIDAEKLVCKQIIITRDIKRS